MSSGRVWTNEEQAVVRRLYPAGGVRAVVAALPHRNGTEVRSWASRNRVACPQNQAITPEMEVEIAPLYRNGGQAAVLQRYPALNPCTLRGWACRRGIRKIPKPKVERKPKVRAVPFCAPSQSLVEQLDCISFRKWRGPVSAGPLVATIIPEVA